MAEKTEEQKKLTAEERAQRAQVRQERQERKESLAKERDTRVVFARTRDTESVLGIMQAADRALNVLRRNAGLRFSFDEVSQYVDEFKAAAISMHEVTKKMCKAVGTPYRTPKWIEEQENEVQEEG